MHIHISVYLGLSSMTHIKLSCTCYTDSNFVCYRVAVFLSLICHVNVNRTNCSIIYYQCENLLRARYRANGHYMC